MLEDVERDTASEVGGVIDRGESLSLNRECMPESAKCLYCDEVKALDAFNREHVLPEAFGKFANNFVLRGCVCRSCNDFFGDELDRSLARDSKEGLDRFEHGMVERKRGRKLGTRIKVKVRGGRLDGAQLRWELDTTGTALKAAPAPQVGIGRDENGPFKWYRPDEVPPLETLQSDGSFYCVVGGMSARDASELMAKLGLEAAPPVELPDPRAEDGTLDTTTEGVIDRRLRRAIAKVSFNYLAYFYPAIARMDQYRGIRRYVRFDEMPEGNPVTIVRKPIIANLPPDKQLVAHVLTTRWNKTRHETVGQVSLFDWLQYRIRLSADRFLVAPDVVDSGHVFNPVANQIVPLTRDRRRAAKSLPLMTMDEYRTWKAQQVGAEDGPSRNESGA